MGTMSAPIPQVQKLLAPLRERESGIEGRLAELEAQVASSRLELAQVRSEIDCILAWQPPSTLLSLYADGRLKERGARPDGDLDVLGEGKGDGDDAEEEDFFYDCEDEEEEPAPPQPDDPLTREAARESERVFAVCNAAMAVLRREHSDCVAEGLATGNRKMSLLDRCFFDGGWVGGGLAGWGARWVAGQVNVCMYVCMYVSTVREYMGRLVASLPAADGTRPCIPAQLSPPRAGGCSPVCQPHLIAGGSTQMGKVQCLPTSAMCVGVRGQAGF